MIALILAQVRHRAAAAGALALLATFTVAAAVAVPLYLSAARDQVIASAFAEASPAERSIAVEAEIATTAGVGGGLEGLLEEVMHRMPEAPVEPVTGVVVHGMAGSVAAPLVARDGVCDRLVIEGRCPLRAGEVIVAGELPEAFSYVFADKAIELTVVGRYLPAGIPDEYWAGREDLAPRPLRRANPVFTPIATFDEAGVESALGHVDLIVTGLPWPGDRLAELSTNDGYVVRNGIASLVAGTDAQLRRLTLTAGPAAVTMLVLSLWILLLATSQLARGQRPEVALGSLRGVPRGHRFLLERGATILILLAACVPGVGLGWLLLRLAWGPVELTAAAAGAGLAVTLVGVLTVSFVERGMPLLDSFRRVGSRLRRPALLLDAVVVTLAITAVAQAVSGEAGIAPLAPVLVAAAVGLVAARLVRPVASALGQSWIQRGRLVAGLAALRLSRRPGAAPALTLVVLCLALTGQAAAAWQELSGRVQREAVDRLGAAQVVDVAAPSRASLMAAVRTVDPTGSWAVAAVRDRLAEGRELVALDTTRMVSALDIAAPDRLRPPAGEAVRVDGAQLVLDLTVIQPVAPIVIVAALVGPDGAGVLREIEVPARAGRGEHIVAVPECVTAPGCHLAWLSFPRSPDELRLHGLRQRGPERDLVNLASPHRFRASFELEPEIILRHEPDYLAVRYRPLDPRNLSRDIRLRVADAPVPVPVVVAGEPDLVHSHELSEVTMLGTAPRPVTVVSGQKVRGVPESGVLVDLEYADRLSDTFDNRARLQVWLGPDAPSDAVARLEAAGLIPLRADSVTALSSRLRLGGEGLGLRLHLAAAGMAVLLTILALLVLSGVDNRERARELAALRDQGVSGVTIRRVAHLGQLVVVATAVPVALAAGGPPSWPMLVALLALAGSAWYADRRARKATEALQ